ncbi:MAG: T9SS type A sorting domain-containing protein [Bacteroidetes bacterium]|nr:T9SS type A sorting domain-containing protein [Bacteroidota bacterium]
MRYAIPFLFLLAAPVLAQTPGSCELGVAEGDLDINQVFARVFNTGALFFGNETRAGNGYFIPKTSGKSPIFAAAFWVGGLVGGELRVAAARYTRYEMWPGPLDSGATLPNPTDCTAYDRIFVVSREDVAHFLQTGEATDDLRDWPVDWGAPVLDGDGIEGNYDLEEGDQPAIMGDQMAWWVMNDVGNVHEDTRSDPLGIEVQVSAFAASRGARAIEQATYYRYVIVNRNSLTIDSAYVSLFVDADLGDATDDWIGSDTTLSMGYVFNGDDFDNPTYGIGYGIPPAQGYQVVQGPVGLPNGRDDDRDGVVDEPDERLNMTAATYFCNGCYWEGDMRGKETYFNQMQGLWWEGTPFTASGLGYQTNGPVTKFVFPADPATGECWSMANDCKGSFVAPSDQRLVIHTGPFRVQPGESTEVVFAMPFAQGGNHLDSVAKLRVAAEIVKNAWDTGFLAPSLVEVEPGLEPESFWLQVSAPFPNPFTDQTTIRYELSEAMVARMAVYDALGREVAVLADGEQHAGSYEVIFDGADLAPGTYVVRFEAAGEERAFTMIKLR